MIMGQHRTDVLPYDNGTTRHCRADRTIRHIEKTLNHAVCFFAVSSSVQIFTSSLMSNQRE